MDQYLTFMLAGEEYGVDILCVQEITGWSGVTPLPNMPDFILGIINLRGAVVPIIGLRKCFGLESIPFRSTNAVIVAKVTHEEFGEHTMGMVVDAVSRVHCLIKTDVRSISEFDGVISTDSITGVAIVEDEMVILLDINHLMPVRSTYWKHVATAQDNFEVASREPS